MGAKLGRMEFVLNVQNVITLIKMEFAVKSSLNVKPSMLLKVSVKAATKDGIL